MKIPFNKEKSTEVINGLVQNTVDFSKKAADSAKQNIAAVIEKTKNDAQQRKIKKYNPLFPETFLSETFAIPNMIIIVDDAVRRGIDVCEGAIGWLSNDTGMEILHLYDEAVASCGLQFVPVAACDAVYYVDNYDRKRFIRLDCLFSKSHEERMAELKHIAHSLGAKRCTIKIIEAEQRSQQNEKKISVQEKYGSSAGNESSEQNFFANAQNTRSGIIQAEFSGSSSPKMPTLKWFSHDDNIKRLIDIRCNSENAIKKETLELSGASSATMSQKTAYAIDGAVGKVGGAAGAISINSQANNEHKSTLIFEVEF